MKAQKISRESSVVSPNRCSILRMYSVFPKNAFPVCFVLGLEAKAVEIQGPLSSLR